MFDANVLHTAGRQKVKHGCCLQFTERERERVKAKESQSEIERDAGHVTLLHLLCARVCVAPHTLLISRNEAINQNKIKKCESLCVCRERNTCRALNSSLNSRPNRALLSRPLDNKREGDCINQVICGLCLELDLESV